MDDFIFLDKGVILMKTSYSRLVPTLVALALTVGCGAENKPSVGSSGGTHTHAGHKPGPHDGTVADWGGGKYHVEFTVDHGKQETVVYVLGADEKAAAPIKAKDGKLLLSIKQPAFQIELQADPQSGETGGASSRFVGKHEKLGVVQEFAGTISGEADGTPYVGDFKEEPHGPHTH
jgi:hypothetical protein